MGEPEVFDIHAVEDLLQMRAGRCDLAATGSIIRKGTIVHRNNCDKAGRKKKAAEHAHVRLSLHKGRTHTRRHGSRPGRATKEKFQDLSKVSIDRNRSRYGGPPSYGRGKAERRRSSAEPQLWKNVVSAVRIVSYHCCRSRNGARTLVAAFRACRRIFWHLRPSSLF
jgi:hypothetical protein